MIDYSTLRKEARYGMPAADQIIFNRYYITGYSYYFRQAKWTLEIVNPPVIHEQEDTERADNFRSDYRIPKMFRADKVDFKNSGFDRGHLVPSADQIGNNLNNSETFLLSNMSPQRPGLNRDIWRQLENKVRELNNKIEILETYIITGPVFNFDTPVTTIGENDNNQVTIPVPHAFFKTILTEDEGGNLQFYSFIIPNQKQQQPLKKFLVSTRKVEQYTGILLFDRLVGPEIDAMKKRINKIW